MLIGGHGTIELQREWPQPLFVPDSQVVVLATRDNPSGNMLLVKNDGWLDGQRTLVTNKGGMPFAEPGRLYPPYPDILRFWGAPEETPSRTGPTSRHREDGTVIFWYDTANGDERPFWEDRDTVGLVEQITTYINRDGLDRVSFYTTESGALTRDPEQRFTLYAAAFGSILLAPSPETPPEPYLTALLSEEEKQPALEIETELTPLPPAIQAVYDNPDYRDWYYLGTVTSYQLESDARMLDTATIGEDFGDYQKGLITGAGNFNALFRRKLVAKELEGRDLLRMVYMTRTGAKARARFSLTSRDQTSDVEANVSLEGDILIGRGSLSVAADDIVRLQTDFVVVKDASGLGMRPTFGSLD